MPFVDFRTEPVGPRPPSWPIAGFTVFGNPGVEIRDTSPPGAAGVTAHHELVITLPAKASNVLVDLIVGNKIVVEALDVGGAVVDRKSFAAATGPTAAVFTTPNPEIERIRMTNSGTEDRVTIIFSA